MLFKVISLNVLGHSSKDCIQYGCKCVSHVSDSEREEDAAPIDSMEHDENRCTCRFEINDRHGLGRVKFDRDCSEAEIITALIAEGILGNSSNVQINQEEQFLFEVLEKGTGKPLYQLEHELNKGDIVSVRPYNGLSSGLKYEAMTGTLMDDAGCSEGWDVVEVKRADDNTVHSVYCFSLNRD